MKYLLMSARHTPELHSTVTMIKRVVAVKRHAEVLMYKASIN